MAAGKTQAEMHFYTGIQGATWSNYEKGGTEPDIETMLKIAEAFKVSLSDLVQRNFEEGNLILKSRPSKKTEKSNVKGNATGNLTAKKYPKSSELSIVNDDGDNQYYPSTMPKVITIDTQGNENMVMVPVKARAGYLLGYGDPEFIQTLPAYRLPGLNNGTFRIFEVEGLSMYPTLNIGDLVIGSNIDQMGLIRDDRIHIIVTKNEGVLVKRVLNRLNQDDKLILKSDNYKDRDLYPPIVCDPVDVLEIWYATGYISRQMRPPAEMYNRVVDLEGRLTLLEKKLNQK